MEITSKDKDSEEFIAELKIPKERVAVLIGVNGVTKRRIEKLTKTKLEVDSKEGDVLVHGEDGLDIYETREIIKAIGRGFNPEIALKLLDMDYNLEIIRISDYSNSKNTEIRMKGRLIGTGGKTRRAIEELTETYISIYGKTISIIGKIESSNAAKRAIIMLLQGAPHSTAYNWLERKRKTLKRMEFEAREGIEIKEDDDGEL